MGKQTQNRPKKTKQGENINKADITNNNFTQEKMKIMWENKFMRDKNLNQRESEKKKKKKKYFRRTRENRTKWIERKNYRVERK